MYLTQCVERQERQRQIVFSARNSNASSCLSPLEGWVGVWSAFVLWYCKLTTNFKFLSHGLLLTCARNEVWGMERFFSMYLLYSPLSTPCIPVPCPCLSCWSRCILLVTRCQTNGCDQRILSSSSSALALHTLCAPGTQEWSIFCVAASPHPWHSNSSFYLWRLLGKNIISCPSLNDGGFLLCIHVGS